MVVGEQVRPVSSGVLARLRVIAADWPLSDAVRVAFWLAPIAPMEIANDPVEDPAGIDTDAGTVKAARLLLNETATAAVAAGETVTVQLAVPLLARLLGEHEIADTNEASDIVTEADCVAPLAEAVITVAWVASETAAVPVKEAVADPAGMVRLGGSVRPALLLEIATTKPPDGADAEMVT